MLDEPPLIVWMRGFTRFTDASFALLQSALILRLERVIQTCGKCSDLRWQTPESPSEGAQGLYIGFCIETVS